MKVPKFLSGPAKTGWEQLILSILGITISIALTFGLNALSGKRSQKADRRLAAVRVMASIEAFARQLDAVHDMMLPADTAAAYLLDHWGYLDALSGQELIDLHMASVPGAMITYDKSAEQIFSSSFDVWRNVDNAKFMDSAGQCFHMMEMITEEHNSWIDGYIQFSDNYVATHRQQFDTDLQAFALGLFGTWQARQFLGDVHPRMDRLQYVSALLRWSNAQSMKLMKIKEKDVMKEVADSEAIPTGEPMPQQEEFETPRPSMQ